MTKCFLLCLFLSFFLVCVSSSLKNTAIKLPPSIAQGCVYAEASDGLAAQSFKGAIDIDR